jgi:hypothetical protein
MQTSRDWRSASRRVRPHRSCQAAVTIATGPQSLTEGVHHGYHHLVVERWNDPLGRLLRHRAAQHLLSAASEVQLLRAIAASQDVRLSRQARSEAVA